MRDLLKTFTSAFAIGFSGAVTPGPLLVACAYSTLKSGFWAGMTTVVGHAAAELILVIVLLAGLARYLKKRPRAFRIVKGVAGVVLLLLGVMILIAAPKATFDISAPEGEAGGRHALPLLMGAAVSVGNPYWLLWWATVGLTLLGNAARKGKAAVPTFYVGHVLSDFVWFAFIAASLALGRTTVLGPTSYRILLVASGLFMVAFGAWFAFRRDKPAEAGPDHSPAP